MGTAGLGADGYADNAAGLVALRKQHGESGKTILMCPLGSQARSWHLYPSD